MKNTKGLLLILTGFIIGYTIASVFIKMPTLEEARSQAASKATTQLKKEIAEKEKNYRQKIDSLNTKEAQLSNDLTTIKAQMAVVGNKYRRLKDQLQAITGKRPIAFPDTASCQQQNDTLRAGITSLIDSQMEKDSLCNAEVDNLEQQVNNRDTVIMNQDSFTKTLKGTLEQSFLQQDILQKQNTNYRRQIKKQKLRNTLKSVGVIILSALSAKYLLAR
jgi:DNA repair exonuclease SbcCD ATPase subunit